MTAQTLALFKNAAELAPRGGGGAGGMTLQEKVKRILDDIMERMPELFPLAELDERTLPLRADDGLAVDALEGEALDAAAVHGVGELGERGADALVERLDEHLQTLAAAFDVEHGVATGDHDVGARRARRRAV